MEPVPTYGTKDVEMGLALKWLFILPLHPVLWQLPGDCFTMSSWALCETGVWFGGGGTFCDHAQVQSVQHARMGGPAALHMKKKDRRSFVILECTEARAEGKPPSRYTTTKNRRNTPEPLQLRKYNKFLKRHTIHKELK